MYIVSQQDEGIYGKDVSGGNRIIERNALDQSFLIESFVARDHLCLLEPMVATPGQETQRSRLKSEYPSTLSGCKNEVNTINKSTMDDDSRISRPAPYHVNATTPPTKGNHLRLTFVSCIHRKGDIVLLRHG